MSRMTKFLRQACTVSKVKRDSSGVATIDRYGSPQYDRPISIRCRMEPSEELVQDSNGAMIRSTATYYLDDAMEVSIGDLIDGKPVIKVEAYVNAYGIAIGREVYV